MKIKMVKVVVCSPRRNFVTVKIETDAGVYGLGDATLNGREIAVVAYLEEHLGGKSRHRLRAYTHAQGIPEEVAELVA